jgi:hypothetical protein
MDPRIVSASLLLFAALITSANGGPVYLSLVLNPATTANAGGLDGTSTQSGANSWHLYAFDDTDGSLGIATFSVTMSNVINTVFNRSPSTLWNDGDSDYNAGLRELRSNNDNTAFANPITGGQPLPGSTPIGPILGLGRTASNFTAKIPEATSGFSSTTSSRWGNYATDPPSNPQLTGLLLAEGTWLGSVAPTITAARIQLYSSAGGVIEANECFTSPSFCGSGNNPPEISVRANGLFINDGDMTPSVFDGTDFGYPHALNSTDTQRFEIINSGDLLLQLGTPVITGPFFLVGDFPTSAFRDREEVFWIALDTSTPGKFQGSISFSNNDSTENPFNFALYGEVIPEPTAISLFVVGISACSVFCRSPREWASRTKWLSIAIQRPTLAPPVDIHRFIDVKELGRN